MTFMHSPTLFLDDRGNGLHLVIKSDLEKTGVKELIKHGGGLVYNEATEYSIIFASPDCEVMEDEELYSCEYIKECCGQNKLLDLKPYRLNKHSKYPASFNPNDVFLKYTTWIDALQGKSFERFVLPFDPDDSSTDSSSTSDETSLPQIPTSSGTKRREYTESERKKIIKCIIKNKAYSSVKGRELWQKMEDNKICPGRTWQSLKEHFTKKILPRIDRFGLTEKELRKFKTQENNSSSSDTEFSESLLTSEAKKEKTTGLKRINVGEISDKFCNEKNDMQTEDKVTNKENEISCSGDEENRVPQKSFKVAAAFEKSTQKLKRPRENSSKSEDSDSNTIEASLNSLPGKKIQRKDFTESERKKIIKYIMENKAYSSLKRCEFWQKMEEEEICPGWTWQSLKEHFTKKILPSIDKFGLPEKEVRNFKAEEENSSSSDTESSASKTTAESTPKKKRTTGLKTINVVKSSDIEFCAEENDLEIKDKSTNKEKESSCTDDDEDRAPRTRFRVAKAFTKRTRQISSSGNEDSDWSLKESSLSSPENKIQRREYTEFERKKIIKFIKENNAYASVKGREFWQNMEEEEICPGRTWQSLKEHFIKKILPSIDKFDLLEKEVRQFKAQEENSSSSDIAASRPALTAQVKSKKRRKIELKRIYVAESSDSEFCDEENDLEIEDKSANKEKESLYPKDDESRVPLTRIKVAAAFAKSVQERKKPDVGSSSESVGSSSALTSFSGKKIQRREYTESERKRIIKYIIENKAYISVKGRDFWKRMEEKEICPGRTWQSLKEHFTKKILPRIDRFGLSEKEVRRFKAPEENSRSPNADSSGSVPTAESGLKRRDYSRSEKLKIINYIIRCKAFKFVKGREFWQRMEMNQICPGRTWQSMKEHYTKQIIPRIDSFGLPDEAAERLKRIFK